MILHRKKTDNINVVLRKKQKRQAQIELDEMEKKIKSLSETNAELRNVINNLNETINELNQTIKELNEKLNKTPKNSSKPPSSEGLNKPAPKSLRISSGKKPGGQVGHPGTSLVTLTIPDETIPHMPSTCVKCKHHDLCKNNSAIGEKRQVIDAVVDVKITEHQSLVIDCPRYGVQLKGEFPDSIRAPVQYGQNLQALAVSMNTIGAVSLDRTKEILSGIFNIPLSTGTICNMVSSCANTVERAVEDIRQKLTEVEVINCDETGTRVEGKTMWVHNASNSQYTHLSIHEKRGQEGIDSGMVLPQFKGIAVHDCWAPYWKYPQISHALCNVHLLRELNGIQENNPEQKWPGDFKDLMLEMKGAKEQAIDKGKDRITKKMNEDFNQRYEEILSAGYAENPEVQTDNKKRGRKKKGKILSLIDRLSTYQESVCLFIENFAVPFENNQAERDIRMVKVKTKVSGCFRTIEGARNYLKIMSYIGTAKKHGYNAFKSIYQAISGNPDFIFEN